MPPPPKKKNIQFTMFFFISTCEEFIKNLNEVHIPPYAKPDGTVKSLEVGDRA